MAMAARVEGFWSVLFLYLASALVSEALHLPVIAASLGVAGLGIMSSQGGLRATNVAAMQCMASCQCGPLCSTKDIADASSVTS